VRARVRAGRPDQRVEGALHPAPLPAAPPGPVGCVRVVGRPGRAVRRVWPDGLGRAARARAHGCYPAHLAPTTAAAAPEQVGPARPATASARMAPQPPASRRPAGGPGPTRTRAPRTPC